MVTTRRRSRLTRSIQIELIKYFCAGATARSAAELSGINRNTAILFFHKLRDVILEEPAALEPGLMGGEIEVDARSSKAVSGYEVNTNAPVLSSLISGRGFESSARLSGRAIIQEGLPMLPRKPTLMPRSANKTSVQSGSLRITSR